MKKSERKCGNCHHWHSVVHGSEGEVLGFCTAHPPQTTCAATISVAASTKGTHYYSDMAAYPGTPSDESCGEWKEKTND